MNPETEAQIDRLYHLILENLNKVYSHPVMYGVPALRDNLSLAANKIKELRELKEKQLQ